MLYCGTLHQGMQTYAAIHLECLTAIVPLCASFSQSASNDNSVPLAHRHRSGLLTSRLASLGHWTVETRYHNKFAKI